MIQLYRCKLCLIVTAYMERHFTGFYWFCPMCDGPTPHEHLTTIQNDANGIGTLLGSRGVVEGPGDNKQGDG